jgi:hypothetical protein
MVVGSGGLPSWLVCCFLWYSAACFFVLSLLQALAACVCVAPVGVALFFARCLLFLASCACAFSFGEAVLVFFLGVLWPCLWLL